MYERVGKRFLDIVLTLFAMVTLIPLVFIVSILIKTFDPGPVLFVQQRAGRFGRPFRFYKFRSMPKDTEDIPSDQLGEIQLPLFSRFIRRTNIDELPQLVNVLVGEMSIVGPRPPIPSQKELLRLRRENGALRCRPGLTGLAQVRSYHGMSVEQKARYDGIYASEISLFSDVMIILKTFSYLLKKPPTY